MLDKSSTLYLSTYYHCCRTFQIGFICCSFNELKPKDSELVKKGRHIIPLTSQKVHPIGEWGGREKKAGAREIKNPHFCSSKKWWHPNKNLRMFFSHLASFFSQISWQLAYLMRGVLRVTPLAVWRDFTLKPLLSVFKVWPILEGFF